MYYYDSTQHIFDRALWAIVAVAKWLLQALVYLPFWFCGYLLSTLLLEKQDSVWAWLITTVIFGVLLYQLLFFIKGIMIGLKDRNNAWWIVLFIICCTFTCIAPAWIVFQNIQPLVANWTTTASDTLSWLFSIAFGCWVYSRYHFLTDVAPRAAYPIYQLGINLTE